jgi:hypothetical protein
VAPEAPAEPATVETPVVPEAPAEPLAVETPVVPETPAEPVAVETPVVPETPAEPVAVEAPAQAVAVEAPAEPSSPPEGPSETEMPLELPESPQARFGVFRVWLDEQGPRYQVWANDCIFIAVNPPVLELEFPKGFRHSHVSATDKDELLLEGVHRFFPDCTRVRVRNRNEGSDRLTHREAVAKEAAEAQAELERVIAENADIQTIASHFDAAIRSVHKDHHAPMPPVLSGQEDY